MAFMQQFFFQIELRGPFGHAPGGELFLIFEYIEGSLHHCIAAGLSICRYGTTMGMVEICFEIPHQILGALGVILSLFYWLLPHDMDQDKANELKELQSDMVICMRHEPLVISGANSTMECTRNAHIVIHMYIYIYI